MHNRIGFNRLDRKPSHRKALHRNMVTSLIKYQRIETTSAKAREIRRTAEKLVTRAKIDSVHNRRIAARTVYEKDVLNKLFSEVGPRFSQRPGGYTRILKLGRRNGDAAEMVILEFLPEEKPSTKPTPVAKKKAEPKKSSGPAITPNPAKSKAKLAVNAGTETENAAEDETPKASESENRTKKSSR